MADETFKDRVAAARQWSVTTLSSIAGLLFGAIYLLMPVFEHSTNPTVRAIVGVLSLLGFGGSGLAAPDASKTVNTDDLSRLPQHEPITPASLITRGPPPEKKDA